MDSLVAVLVPVLLLSPFAAIIFGISYLFEGGRKRKFKGLLLVLLGLLLIIVGLMFLGSMRLTGC